MTVGASPSDRISPQVLREYALLAEGLAAFEDAVVGDPASLPGDSHHVVLALHRLAELERFQRLPVGRELKMIELKKEIETLRRFGPGDCDDPGDLG